VIDLDQATKLDDPLLALGTHVVSSAEALRGITGLADYGAGLKRLAEHVGGFLAVTDGPHGVYWLDHSGLRHMPAFKVNAIDSLGAGDAFHGAFTLALAEGRDLVDAMRFASATAALKCTKFGGASGAPQRVEVEEFLLRFRHGC
jgi:sulfofructose kinase